MLGLPLQMIKRQHTDVLLMLESRDFHNFPQYLFLFSILLLLEEALDDGLVDVVLVMQDRFASSHGTNDRA